MGSASTGSAVSVHCLGVGEGWPCAQRSHAAFIYRFGDRRILVDCGDGASRRLREMGWKPEDLDGVLLSHFHSDHVGGFPMLVQGTWLAGRRRAMPVHAPAAGIGPLRRWLNATLLFDELIGFELAFAPLRARGAFRIGGIRVTPFPTGHLDSLRRGFGRGRRGVSFEAFGFEVAGLGRRVVHSADLGSVDDLVPALRRPLDLLVCELSHIEPAALWGALGGAPVRRVALVHMASDLWARRRAVLRDARRALPGVDVIVPGDGHAIEL